MHRKLAHSVSSPRECVYLDSKRRVSSQRLAQTKRVVWDRSMIPVKDSIVRDERVK